MAFGGTLAIGEAATAYFIEGLPIGRAFALLGYEIVEGIVRRGAIQENRRVTFAPAAKLAASAR